MRNMSIKLLRYLRRRIPLFRSNPSINSGRAVQYPFVLSLSKHANGQKPQFPAKQKKTSIPLNKLIEQKIAALFAGIESPFLLNQRHYNLLLALENKLEEIQQMLAAKKVAYELLSIHLNDALAHLAQLSGKSISEAGMDMVFREFCIGK